MRDMKKCEYGDKTVRIGDEIWGYNLGRRVLRIVEWGPRNNVWIFYGELVHMRSGEEENNDMRVCTIQKWISHVRKHYASYRPCSTK